MSGLETIILAVGAGASVAALCAMVAQRIAVLVRAARGRIAYKIGDETIEIEGDFKPEDIARIKKALSALEPANQASTGRG